MEKADFLVKHDLIGFVELDPYEPDPTILTHIFQIIPKGKIVESLVYLWDRGMSIVALDSISNTTCLAIENGININKEILGLDTKSIEIYKKRESEWFDKLLDYLSIKS